MAARQVPAARRAHIDAGVEAEITPRSRRAHAEKGGRASAQEWKEGNGAVNPDYDERRYDGYSDGVHAVLRRLNEHVINQAR